MVSLRTYLLMLVTVLSLTAITPTEAVVYELVRTLIQDNLAGTPIIHQREEFDFDPDISQKRRQQFYELNGFRAEKFIERIGLGIDGKAPERLFQQRQRDAGRLQGTAV